jgi:hypothetical protein
VRAGAPGRYCASCALINTLSNSAEMAISPAVRISTSLGWDPTQRSRALTRDKRRLRDFLLAKRWSWRKRKTALRAECPLEVAVAKVDAIVDNSRNLRKKVIDKSRVRKTLGLRRRV